MWGRWPWCEESRGACRPIRSGREFPRSRDESCRRGIRGRNPCAFQGASRKLHGARAARRAWRRPVRRRRCNRKFYGRRGFRRLRTAFELVSEEVWSRDPPLRENLCDCRLAENLFLLKNWPKSYQKRKKIKRPGGGEFAPESSRFASGCRVGRSVLRP